MPVVVCVVEELGEECTRAVFVVKGVVVVPHGITSVEVTNNKSRHGLSAAKQERNRGHKAKKGIPVSHRGMA